MVGSALSGGPSSERLRDILRNRGLLIETNKRFMRYRRARLVKPKGGAAEIPAPPEIVLLREIMRVSYLFYSDMARDIGIDKKTLWRVLNGKVRQPYGRTMKRVRAYLKSHRELVKSIDDHGTRPAAK